jgi:DNA-binding NarL/FixJ family response regulator
MKMAEKSLNLLIADNQFLITESLKYILQNDERFIVGRTLLEKNELINEISLQNTDILIIDPILIDFTGLVELQEIRDIAPELKILVLTNYLSRSELNELNSYGITNIILKTAGKEEIIEALEAILKGKKYYSNELLDLLFEPPERKRAGEDPVQLTNSEIEIVRIISEGLTTKEIASRRNISFHTVISHRKNIFRKLGVTSVSELIMYAIRSGWINDIEYHI